ncbi:Subtilisin-like serine protease [Halalkaliarchaeum sp. AArc-CO]|uniref:S8 family peptidase n=1 Tax=Halalkaliarchaeum sp. AArc-CO TaxID=2866381 RepID=UPI00217DD081|nr:S8 family serine peptidase [Halalkaliarchaeum sp. AArc-CO]UWG51179.1 Subtilisin-like serine protease [Halalkaliarchaeum sp. AArc-CO]
MKQQRRQTVRRRNILQATAGAIFVGALGVSTTFAGVATASSGDPRYVITANQNAKPRIERAGFDVSHGLADDTVLIVVGSEEDQAELERIPGVQHVTRDIEFKLDEVLVDDSAMDKSAGLHPEGAETPEYWDFQWEKRRINVREAHEIATGAGTTIAIVDTGIQPDHPDLGNLNETDSIAIIEGERIEAGEPIDVGPFSHGTMVAGIAAAQGEGILGTAPDAELVSIRVFSEEGFATGVDVLLALEYAAEIGADAVNLSLGTVPLPPEANAAGLRAARERVANQVVRDGTVITASAGNGNANLQHGGWFRFYSSLAGTIAASATGADDLLTFYSDYGTNVIDVAAPGGGMADAVKSYCGILEYFFEDRIAEPGEQTQVCFAYPDAVFPIPVPPDYPGAECFHCTTSDYPFPLNAILSTTYNPFTGEYGYEWQGGTSFAAPHVAGLVALVRELDPTMNPRRVASAIQQGAEGSAGRSDPEVGAGRINALSTVQRVKG